MWLTGFKASTNCCYYYFYYYYYDDDDDDYWSVSLRVYMRVFRDLELLCSSLFDRTTALISRWDE